MPIRCPISLQSISDGAFEEIDRLVMSCSYTSQNTLGRLCDERLYENDVAARLRAEGAPDVVTQVPVTVAHDGFQKIYRIDLVVNQMVYEFKTVTALVSEHDAQGIHYAVMLGVDRVKLINFRTPKVVGKLIRSPLGRVDRTKVRASDSRWMELSEPCRRLKERMMALLGDVGAFLEAWLYEEALVHFAGGEPHCVRRLPVVRDGLELGTHRLACHAPDLAFVVTAFCETAAAHESHLRRLIRFTDLRGVQWINLNRDEVQFVTLQKEKGKGMEAKE